MATEHRCFNAPEKERHTPPHPYSKFLRPGAICQCKKRRQERDREKEELHRNTLRASLGWLSLGQYGHLNRLLFPRRFSDSSAMTCPQGIIIGGFSSVACSLDTGQTKIEWKRYEGGSEISTW